MQLDHSANHIQPRERRDATIHDPIFDHFPGWSGPVPDGYYVDWVGALTTTDFYNLLAPPTGRHETPPLPVQTTEEYTEWVAMLTSIKEAADAGRTFRMVELGAGFGRWIADGALALRQSGFGIPFELVGVEAEPSHFAWMKTHMENNAIPLDRVRMVEAAVTGEPVGTVQFQIGDAQEWYGQSVSAKQFEGVKVADVTAITLDELLVPYWYVDLIDIDIQGTEAEVLATASNVLCNKVHRVCVGTHSQANERKIRELFGDLGWFCEDDYSLLGNRCTRWGWALFDGDGVQVWVNPRTDVFDAS